MGKKAAVVLGGAGLGVACADMAREESVLRGAITRSKKNGGFTWGKALACAGALAGAGALSWAAYNKYNASKTSPVPEENDDTSSEDPPETPQNASATSKQGSSKISSK